MSWSMVPVVGPVVRKAVMAAAVASPPGRCLLYQVKYSEWLSVLQGELEIM
jgi:hypothetical protein